MFSIVPLLPTIAILPEEFNPLIYVGVKATPSNFAKKLLFVGVTAISLVKFISVKERP
jgi:hypothetical protein